MCSNLATIMKNAALAKAQADAAAAAEEAARGARKPLQSPDQNQLLRKLFGSRRNSLRIDLAAPSVGGASYGQPTLGT